MGTGGFSVGVKRPGCETDRSPESSAKVKECVELYIHFPNTSSCKFVTGLLTSFSSRRLAEISRWANTQLSLTWPLAFEMQISEMKMYQEVSVFSYRQNLFCYTHDAIGWSK